MLESILYWQSNRHRAGSFRTKSKGEGFMKSFLWIIPFLVVLSFVLGPIAYASPNPEGTKNITETTPETQPTPVGEKTEKQYDWLDVRVSLSWQYDDNVVLLNDVPKLVPDYDASELVTTVTLRVTPIKTNYWKAGAQYDFYNSAHSDVDYMEIQTHSVLLFATYGNAPSYLYFPVSTNLYILDHGTYLQTIRFAPTYYYEQSTNWLLTLGGSYEILDYRLAIDRPYDATDYLVRVGETYLFSRKSWIKAEVSYNYLKAHENWASYAGPKFLISYDTPLLYEISATVSLSYHYRDYRDPFPSTSISRVDKRSVFDVYLSRPIKWGLTAFGRYTYVENNSNTHDYDYSRQIVTIGIEWNY